MNEKSNCLLTQLVITHGQLLLDVPGAILVALRVHVNRGLTSASESAGYCALSFPDEETVLERLSTFFLRLRSQLLAEASLALNRRVCCLAAADAAPRRPGTCCVPGPALVPVLNLLPARRADKGRQADPEVLDPSGCQPPASSTGHMANAWGAVGNRC